MGVAASQASDADADTEDLPLAFHSPQVWTITCRQLFSMNLFSSELLLFQPDCRRFCPSGEKCALLARPQHAELFLHTSKLALEADAASLPPSTYSDGGPMSQPLPNVSTVWQLSTKEGESSAMPAALTGRRVIFWVHGFRQRYFRVVNVADHLRSATDDASGSPPLVVSFVWPCHSKKAAFSLARRSSQQAAPLLAAALRALRTAGCHVTLVGHSLGCRVALGALLCERPESRERPSREQTPPRLCDDLLLLGAAVSCNALSLSGEFPLARLSTGHVTVLHSSRDEVLASHFALGEFASGARLGAKALGLVGPVGIDFTSPENQETISSIDVSDSVPAHNPNQWLLSRAVIEQIAHPPAQRKMMHATQPHKRQRLPVPGMHSTVCAPCEPGQQPTPKQLDSLSDEK